MFSSLINKWSVKKAAKNGIKGDWESREVPYSANVNVTFLKHVNVPLTVKNLTVAKINNQDIEDKTTNFQSNSNFEGITSNNSNENLCSEVHQF